MDITYVILLGAASAVIAIGLLFMIFSNRGNSPEQSPEFMPSPAKRGAQSELGAEKRKGKGASIIAELEQEERIDSNETLLKKIAAPDLGTYRLAAVATPENIPVSTVRDEGYFVTEQAAVQQPSHATVHKPFINPKNINPVINSRHIPRRSTGTSGPRSKPPRREGPLLGVEFANKHSHFDASTMKGRR